jgi:6-phosphogluconolactonase
MIAKPLFLAALLMSVPSAFAGEMLLYAGSYTGGKSSSKGITLLKMNTDTGALTVAGTAAELASPSYLALSPDGTRLYAVSESGNSAAAFKVDKTTGALTKLNELPVADKKDQGACHLCVVPEAKMLVTANYGGGSVSTFSLAEDGSLAARTGFIQHTGGSVDKGRQKEPHGHGAILSPDGKYVLVNDLGTDRVYIYEVDAAAHTLKPKPAGEGVSPPGSGPRHSAFSTDGKHVFAINEMLCTVTTFAWDPKVPSLTAGATVSTLPEAVKPAYSTAEIVVHPNGKFVYGSNRGHDSIAVFSNADGALTRIENTPSGGRTPRNFNLTPDGKWLLSAHENSDDIKVFSVNQETGKLTPTAHSAKVGKPVCIVFLSK